MKLYEIRTSGSGGDVVKRKSLRREDGQRPITIPHLEPSVIFRAFYSSPGP